MTGKKPKWTPSQLKAINHRGNDILVTASAGTGKTAVLSGRCVDIVSDSAACPDVRNVLVLTFTEAAAAEMKTRIGQSLKDKYLQSRDSHLKRQLLLLDAAEISTIHSFCKRLISEYFYKLGIDPAFRIIDNDEQYLIKTQIRDEVVLEAHEDSVLAPAVIELLKGRPIGGPVNFLNIIIDIHDYLDSIVSRPNWYAAAEQLAACLNPLLGQLGQRQTEILCRKVDGCINLLRHSQMLDQRLANGHWHAQIEDDFLAPITWCAKQIKKGDIEAAAAMIQGFEKTRNWNNKPKDLSKDVAEFIKEPAEKALHIFKSLSQLAIINPQYLNIISESASSQAKTLLELVKRFENRYRRLKTQLNCLDFSDLEHLALELLTNVDDGKPSPIAIELRKRFKHIFIDEYQDINAVQQAILDSLSCVDNVFVVGDIKQSIYAFRQAQPKIFLRRLTNASDQPAAPSQGLRIDLGDNFRSRSQILDFVNAVFSRTMTASFADIDYDYKAMLHPHADYKSLEETTTLRPIPPLVEMHLLDNGSDTENPHDQADTNPSSSKLSPNELQAAVIGRRILQMVETAEFKIFDKATDSYRDVAYRDIVILMRSPANKAGDYIRILRLMGVPISSQSSSGYFETTEITDCISLLSVLDNPQRDIELAAVLRSPFFNVSDTELAKIRLAADDKANFYQAALAYLQSGKESALRQKLAAIFARLESWRTMARRGSIADLIWHILRSTGYLSFVSALPNGKQRRANLLKLHERAIQFEGFVTSAKTVSLTRFVEFIEKLLQQGQDWAPAEPDSAAENAVRIMSVHKSKGLEFPVVFLAELETKFNMQDRFGQCLIDTENTLGLEIIDHKTSTRLATIGHQIISETKKAVALAEEMRILYVAMTRARERLILTASAKSKHCHSILQKGSVLDEPAVPDWLLADCQCPLDWILYGLARHHPLLDVFGINANATTADKRQTDEKLFSVNHFANQQIAAISDEVEKLRDRGRAHPMIAASAKSADPVASKIFEQIKSAIGWRYPFLDITKLYAKTSVSQLTHRGDEFAPDSDYAQVLAQSQQLNLLSDISSNNSQLIGTAVHLVMQRLYLAAVSSQNITDIIGNLVASGAVTKEIADNINVNAIAAFFQSKLGLLARDPANTVYREWPFSFGLPADYFLNGGPGASGEKVIVQGIIDLLVQTPSGLVVIDFKTDRITAAQTKFRATVYAPQMNLYALAAQSVLKQPVKAKYLYFLTPNCEVEIPI